MDNQRLFAHYDKCPDDNCGVDLGGAPASDIWELLSGERRMELCPL